MHALIEQHFKESYKSWVKKVYFRVKKEEDAEDIVMEAYTRALKYQDSFREGGTFNHWFSRIIANSVKDWKREQHNQFGHGEEFNEDEHPVIDPSVKRDLLSTIEAEIALVENDDQEEILWLYFIVGCKQQEIVQITNATMGSVNMLVYRFKHKLRGLYME